MIAWLKKARQTRTRVTSASAMAEERIAGLELAARTLCAVLLTVQLLTWLTLFAYDSQLGDSWRSALLTLLPLAALLILWQFSAKRPLVGPRRWLLLLLVPNLWLDIYLCMLGSSSLLENFIPSFPAYGRVLVVTLFPLATVLLSRRNGVPYGVFPLRYLLILMFAISTVFSGADISLRRLQPISLPGLRDLSTGVISGAGAVWPVCLLFLLPLSVPRSQEKKKGLPLFWLIPAIMFLLWALWMSMLHPWQYGDPLLPGQKLTAISQYSRSMLINQLGTLFWTSILPAGLIGSLYAGQEILMTAMPRSPRLLWPLALLLPGAVLLLLPRAWVMGWMEWLLPLRWLTAFAAGVALLFVKGKEARA